MFMLLAYAWYQAPVYLYGLETSSHVEYRPSPRIRFFRVTKFRFSLGAP